MVKINNKMMQYILAIDNSNADVILKKVNEFSKRVFSKIRMVDEVVVVIDFYDEMDKLKSNFILNQYGDYTGFETSFNEIRVIDYMDLENVNKTAFLLRLVDELKRYLNERFSQFSFVIIGAINQGNVNFRFHISRQDEIAWLSDDIDGFNEAIVVNVVDAIL